MTGLALVLRFWQYAVMAVLVLLLTGQQVRVSAAKSELSAMRTSYAQAALKAEKEARAKEATREEEKQAIIDSANKQAEEAIAAVSAADSAASGLRSQLAKYTAAARSNTGAGKGSKSNPSAEALDLFGQLLARTDDAAGAVSLYADRLRIAGIACERQYDSLR